MKNGMVKIGMFLLLVMALGCSKEDLNTQTQTQTTLLIQVTDESGIPVQDAQVKLYGSENDMNNNTNALHRILILDCLVVDLLSSVYLESLL